MERHREIELKLELDPRDAGSVAGALGLSGGKAKSLRATYYDTPDGELRGRGISFRVRRSGDSYIQTIKVARGAAAGLFDRAEWDQPVVRDTPDLAAVDAAGLRDAIADWRALAPAFRVDVERTAWRVPIDAGHVEVVLDQGSVLANGAQGAVSEIELELEGGGAGALFSLAGRIAAGVPVRLGVLTKAERGYRLLTGKAAKPTKAEPLRLPAAATTAEAFALIVQACLRHFRLNEPLIAARNPGGLHQARVALRRLRSAISLFRDVVDDAATAAIKDRLRRLAGMLGEARNLDVLLERLDDAAADPAVRRRLQGEREAAYDRAIAELASAEARRLPLDVLEWAEIGAWRTQPVGGAAAKLERPAVKFAADVLDRYRRRVKKRGRDLSELDAVPRHRVRIEAKKLRYAAEFFGSLFDGKKEGRRAKAFLTALEALQDSLGTLNDIATGHEMAQALAKRGIELLRDVADADETELLQDAEAAHDRLVDAKRFWR